MIELKKEKFVKDRGHDSLHTHPNADKIDSCDGVLTRRELVRSCPHHHRHHHTKLVYGSIKHIHIVFDVGVLFLSFISIQIAHKSEKRMNDRERRMERERQRKKNSMNAKCINHDRC